MASYVAERDGAELDDPEPTTRRASRRVKNTRQDEGGGGGGALERVTVNLSARAARALELIIKLTGDSKTDAINRALQVYAYVEETTAGGGSLYIQDGKDTALQRIKIF
jgi:hypothetical protein